MFVDRFHNDAASEVADGMVIMDLINTHFLRQGVAVSKNMRCFYSHEDILRKEDTNVTVQMKDLLKPSSRIFTLIGHQMSIILEIPFF